MGSEIPNYSEMLEEFNTGVYAPRPDVSKSIKALHDFIYGEDDGLVELVNTFK